MKAKLLVALVASLLLAADAPKKNPAADEVKKLQGTWTPESIEYNGKQFDELAKQLKFVFKGDKGTVEGNAEVKKEYASFVVKLDPSSSPKIMDMTVTAGVQKDATMEGIYELKGDVLKICLKVTGKDRPAEFAAPGGSSIALLVLKRAKP